MYLIIIWLIRRVFCCFTVSWEASSRIEPTKVAMIRIFVYNVITIFAVKGKPMRRLLSAEPSDLYRCGGTSEPRISPQRFVSFSYTRDLLIWSLAQLLLFLQTHPKSDSDVCTYNQSPLCLSVVIATNIFPFKDMCVVFSSVNEWITIVTSRKLPNVVAYSIRKGLSSVAIKAKTLALPPGGQSQATAARVQLPGWTGD